MIASAQFAWLQRVMGLVRKETLQISRDPSSFIIAGLLPVMLLFIFGYGVSLDLRRIPVAVVIEDPSPETDSLLASYQNSRYFQVQVARDRRRVQDELVSGRLHGVIVLDSDFTQRLARRETAPVQVLVDGSDPNSAGLVQIYAQGVWSNWLEQQALERGIKQDTLRAGLVDVEPRYWFNQEIRSQNFLIPGAIAVIITVIGMMLTALVVAREWERGTIEALMAAPLGRSEFLVGKIVPYFLLGMAAMAIATLAAVFLFHVPYRGSILSITVCSAVYLLAMLFQGLLISTVTKNQFAASQAALIGAFLPAFDLSGFIFEIDAMPAPIRAITYILPARYFVATLQTLFLAGDVPEVVIPNTLLIAVMAIVVLIPLVLLTRMRLE
jgi:ABC-2 type transport system permease protein